VQPEEMEESLYPGIARTQKKKREEEGGGSGGRVPLEKEGS